MSRRLCLKMTKTWNEQELKEVLTKVAALKNVEMSEYADKIIKVKTIFNVGTRCPCCQDDREMACISKKCFNDIMRYGHCHCQLFLKKKGVVYE